ARPRPGPPARRGCNPDSCGRSACPPARGWRRRRRFRPSPRLACPVTTRRRGSLSLCQPRRRPRSSAKCTPTPLPRLPSRRSEPSSMRLASWWWALRPNNSGRILRPRWSGGRPSSRQPTSRSANDHSPPRDRAHRSSGTRSKWRRRMFAQTLSGHVWAVPNWPNRFVRLIVPFPPGGGADASARIVSARLSETWGQQVVIENRGGASGNIAAEAAARSAPDGYTIFLAGDFQAVNLYLYPKLSYDPVADFAPVTLVVQYPSAMVVPNSSPSHSVTEFIAYA